MLNWLVLFVHVLYQTPLFDDDLTFCVPGTLRNDNSPCLSFALAFGLHKFNGTCDCDPQCVQNVSPYCTDPFDTSTQVLVSMILLIILAIQYNIYFNTDGIYEEVRLTVDKEHEIVSLENRKRHLDHEKKALEDIAKERKRVGDHIRTRLHELVSRLETWKQEMWDISVGSKSKTLKPPTAPTLKLKDTERNALSLSVVVGDLRTEELRVWVKASSKNDEEEEEEEEEEEKEEEKVEPKVTRTLSSTQSREEKFPLGNVLFVENPQSQ